MRYADLRSLRIAVLAAGLGVAIPAFGQASAQPGLRCATASATGPCFVIHGRLFAANGTPGLRIWVVGTKRILGVHNDDVEPGEPGGYPACLSSHVGFGTNLYADFTVCPVAPDREGWMRPVCIESASNMVIENYLHTAAVEERRIEKIKGVCADP
jgi:hypothetical protein